MLSWFRGRKAKIRRNAQRRKTLLGMEGLEDRAMMAGFVDVSVSGGTLFLRGDAASNGVAVVGTAVPGQFIVIGTDNVPITGSGEAVAATQLRGPGGALSTTLTLNGINNINANLGAGNDQIGITGATGAAYYGGLLVGEYAPNLVVTPPVAPAAGSAATLAGSISVVTGDGNDAVVVIANARGATAIDTGTGNDYAVLESSSTVNLAINTGAGESNLLGSDRVRVRDTAVTVAIGINTYGGSDIVDVFGSTAQTIGINTGDNGGLAFVGVNPLVPEAVRLIGVTAQTVAVNTDAGSDQVIVAGGVAGYSTAGTSIQNLGINTFDGDDVVEIGRLGTAITVQQNMTITTSLGADTIIVGGDAAGVGGASVGSMVSIDTSSGVDNVALRNLLVGYYLYANLGDGDDILSTLNVFAAYSALYGGPGNDTFTPVASGPLNFYQ